MSRMDDLAEVLAQRTVEAGPVTTLRQAVVTDVDGATSTITVRLGGSTVDVPGVRYLASYSPTVSDRVMVLRAGGDLLVLGDLA